MKKTKDFWLFVALNLAMVVLTIAFIAMYPTLLMAFVVLSGWTSLFAVIVADIIMIKAFRAEAEVGRIMQDLDAKQVLARVDSIIKAADDLGTSPEFKEFTKNFSLIYGKLLTLLGLPQTGEEEHGNP